MGKFTHYLITRFNVPVEAWRLDKAGQHTLDDTWLNHRVELFERFCLPSVRQQTQQHFQWILYFDPHTPPVFRKKIESAVEFMPNTSLRFVADMNALLADLGSLIHLSPSPYVMTTRLDNDDAIGRTFIQTLQDHFEEKSNLILNLVGGLYYEVNQNVLTKMKAETCNPHLTLIEQIVPNQKPMTVLAFSHTAIPEEMTIRHLREPGHWLKIIHSRNIKSRLKGKPVFRITTSITEEWGNIPFPLSKWNTVQYLFQRTWKIATSI